MPQGFFGPLAMIGLAANEYLQRYGADPRGRSAAVVVEARKNGARHPVVVLARPAARRSTSTSPRR